MINVRGYLKYRGGYHEYPVVCYLSTLGAYLEYCWGSSVPWRDIMMHVGGGGYHGYRDRGRVQYHGGTQITKDCIHGIPRVHQWYSPTVLRIPQGTQDILVLMISRYSWYPHGTEHTLYRVIMRLFNKQGSCFLYPGTLFSPFKVNITCTLPTTESFVKGFFHYLHNCTDTYE